MKVKIGNTIHDSEIEPITLILTDADKANIDKMSPECSKYTSYPASLPKHVIDQFMEDEPSGKCRRCGCKFETDEQYEYESERHPHTIKPVCGDCMSALYKEFG